MIAILRRATSLLVVAALAVAVPAAEAMTTRWKLDGVLFDDGGVLEGWFTYDARTQTVIDWRLSTGGSGDNQTFAPETHRPDEGGVFRHSIVAVDTFIFHLGPPTGPRRDLRITPAETLTDRGGRVPINVDRAFLISVECFNCNPSRSIDEGSLVGTIVHQPCDCSAPGALVGGERDDYILGTPGNDILCGSRTSIRLQGRIRRRIPRARIVWTLRRIPLKGSFGG